MYKQAICKKITMFTSSNTPKSNQPPCACTLASIPKEGEKETDRKAKKEREIKTEGAHARARARTRERERHAMQHMNSDTCMHACMLPTLYIYPTSAAAWFFSSDSKENPHQPLRLEVDTHIVKSQLATTFNLVNDCTADFLGILPSERSPKYTCSKFSLPLHLPD